MTRTKRAKKDIYKLNISFDKMIILIFSFVMLIGATIGAIVANFISESQFLQLSKFISEFFSSFQLNSINKADIFIECIIKYGKTIIILWFLGFISIGAIFILIVLFFKGISYGFTTAFIIRQFGSKGILYSLALYVPQNIILIPVYFLIAFFSFKYIVKNIGSKEIKNKNYALELKAYVVLLAIGGIFVLLAALIDIFITPYLISVVSFVWICKIILI